MNKPLFFVIIACLFFSACGLEDIVPEEVSFSVNINTTYHSAQLQWSTRELVGEDFLMQLYLNNQLVFEGENLEEYTFENLTDDTFYPGQLAIIRTQDKETFTHPFGFTTLENLGPEAFTVYLDSMANFTVFIHWDASRDPEGDALSYSVTINDDPEAVITTTETTAAVPNLQAGTQYTFTVTATDSGGKSTASQLEVYTPIPGASVTHAETIYRSRVREYSLYLPSTHKEEPLPLLLWLHGAGSTVWPGFLDSYLLEKAETEQFVLLEPQALLGTTHNTFIQWNAHDVLPWNDVAYITSLIDELEEKQLINPRRIYIAGMSNGGYMTFRMARELQDRVAAVAPIAGLIDNYAFQTYQLNRPIPLCYTHGTADDVVRLEAYDWSAGWAEIRDFWLENNQITAEPIITELPNLDYTDLSTVTTFHYPSPDGQADVLFYRINGGFHIVPGDPHPYANGDINTYDEIWKFVSRHTLPE